VAQLVAGLEIDPARLAANLDATRGLVLGEAVMLALGDAIGRLDAHHLVEQASREALQSGRTLHDVLAADPRVSAQLSPEALQRLFDPAYYVGAAHAFVDAVLARHAGRNPGDH
jgi:3-carboxy-cis,cis-muconate cycloisomerase